MASRKIIAVVGGTGSLGGLIVEALLAKQDVKVRMLVRPGSRAKASGFEGRGVEIVEGDIGPGSEHALASLCGGAFAVISAAQGGPDIIVEGQRRLLAAARAAGVHRFIPSDYSFNLFGLDEGENINADWRRRFAEIARSERGNVEVVHVLNGCFLDRRVLFGFLGAFDLNRQIAYVWGDGTQPMDFTTLGDTAKYVAEAATDEAALPEVFPVAGDVLTFPELVQAYETASGKRLTIEKLGSLADLAARIAKLRSEDPANFNAYLPLMYYGPMLSGKGKLDAPMNGRYPSVKTTSVEEYVAQERL
jgi:nucleoside-diphosphate-sugar epimerase